MGTIRFLVLGVIIEFLVGQCVLAQESGGARQASSDVPLETVQSLLQERGWEVREEADGTLTLRPTRRSSESNAEDGLTQLGAVLADRGWEVRRDRQGNLLLFPKGQNTGQAPQVSESSVASGEWVEVRDTAVLAQRLTERGWRVMRDPQGDLLVFPPASRAPVPQLLGETDTLDLDGLAQSLEHRGWRTERDAEGNLLIFPEQMAATTSDPPPLPRAFGRLDELEGVLEQYGWDTGRDEDGNLLLFPPDISSSPRSESETGSGATLIEATDFELLQDRLRQHGWAVNQGEGGSLLVYPPDQMEGGEMISTGSKCQFVRLSPSGEDKRVDLPIDEWEEAYRVATAWIECSGDGQITVGRIRRINRVYLVSIVEKTRPHRLIDQLAVRASDGRVSALLR